MLSKLDSVGRDWVEAKVKEGFEPSRAVNSVLLDQADVPPLLGTSGEVNRILRLAQAQLGDKKAAVNFMMDAEKDGRPKFTYQTKLVAPSNRIDLVKAVLDGQAKTMGTSDKPQQDVEMNEFIKKHLTGRPSRVLAPTWYWELGQGDQIIETPQEGDNPGLTFMGRYKDFLRSLPAGMRGTDRYTWATRMAAGIHDGKPLDIQFEDDARNAKVPKEWNFTVLNEEGELMNGKNSYMLAGTFDPADRRADLSKCAVQNQVDFACFRASIDGSTKEA